MYALASHVKNKNKKTILCIDFFEVSFWLILIGTGACPVTLVLAVEMDVPFS
jgi:hypothetical protein